MSDKKPKIRIFTDGACSGNPGPGGWAAILVSPAGKVRELGGADPKTTNNKMEITAAIEALLSLAGTKQLSTKEIEIFTDSVYLIKGITQWIHGWRKKGWTNAEGEPVANKELWMKLADVITQNEFAIDWIYIPAHSGFPGNERCDEIAVAYSKNAEPILYTGPLSSYRVDVRRVPAPTALPDGKKQGSGPKVIVYLSYVNGKLHKDSTWKACEARVKGVPGAKFKKCESEIEVDAIKASWGVRD